jgi:succinate dehydrogenase / fumarate reductase, flavoprotein subunit
MHLKIENHYHDLLILGSGGAGLSAAIFGIVDRNFNVAVVSKVHPLKSHTIAAQGGINASLGNISEDDWRWHAYDTIKSSAWIADQDSVEEMCRRAPEMINILDEMGVEFDRNESGKIDQKIYGGQSTNFGQGDFAHRACYSKDKTGHTIMHKLYDKSLQQGVNFYNYHFALDLLMKDNRCYGAVIFDMEKGVLRIIHSRNLIIACGGYSQIFATATSAAVCTGDGNGIVARAGIPLQDMEFVQFHPTALDKVGILITEASRSAGGKLLNNKGERFMQKYAPKFMELAPRDIVARAISTEITLGYGCGAEGSYVHLDLTHLEADYIKQNLPTVYENCKTFLSIDPSKESIPIAPAAHYTMGGIPTNNKCQVIKFNEGVEQEITGLYAIGEAACISVHGAGRLGCNSLLDLLVFAKKSIESMVVADHQDVLFSQSLILKRFSSIFEGKEANIEDITKSLKGIMSKYVGVFRIEEGLKLALDQAMEIYNLFQKITIFDKSLSWNLELQHYLELENMIISAIATIRSALWRCESRGAHWRNDFQNENNKFIGHSIFYLQNQENVMLRPVRISSNNVDFYQPTGRNY